MDFDNIWLMLMSFIIEVTKIVAAALIAAWITRKYLVPNTTQQEKLKVLHDIAAYRASLTIVSNSITETHRDRMYSSLNRCVVLFSNNEEILNLLKNWETTGTIDSMKQLIPLICKDVGIAYASDDILDHLLEHPFIPRT